MTRKEGADHDAELGIDVNSPQVRGTAHAALTVGVGMIFLFLAATIRQADEIARLVMLALGVSALNYGFGKSHVSPVEQRMDSMYKVVVHNARSLRGLQANVHDIEDTLSGMPDEARHTTGSGAEGTAGPRPRQEIIPPLDPSTRRVV